MCIPWPFLRLSSHLVPLLLLLLLFFIYFFFLFFVRGAAAARQRDSETSDDEWTERRVVAPYKADRSKETTSLAADCRKIAFPHYDEIKVSSYIAVLTPSPLPPPATVHPLDTPSHTPPPAPTPASSVFQVHSPRFVYKNRN